MPTTSPDEQSASRPQPPGQPGYQRQGGDWLFGCWTYPGSRAVHGRLIGPQGEVFGERYGDAVEAGSFSLVWRGDYRPVGSADRSTGWLFVESFSGPPCIRDRYDPQTDTLPFP